MSTTTDDADGWRGLARGVAWAGVAVGAWMIILAGLTAAIEPTRTIVVVGQPKRILAMLAGTDARIVDSGAYTVTLWANEPGLVRRLYANGARLVLPSRPGGCMGDPRGKWS